MKYPTESQYHLVVKAIAVAALYFTMCLASCTTPKKAASCFDKHQGEAAQYCMAKFPLTPTTITKIITKEGKTDTVKLDGQMVYVDCDSAVKASLDEAARHTGVKCPPTLVLHTVDTLIKHDSTTVIDSRQHYLDLTALAESQQQTTVEKSKADSRGKWLLWESIALAAIVGSWGYREWSKTAVSKIV